MYGNVTWYVYLSQIGYGIFVNKQYVIMLRAVHDTMMKYIYIYLLLALPSI